MKRLPVCLAGVSLVIVALVSAAPTRASGLISLSCMLPPRCVTSTVTALATSDAATKTKYVIVPGDSGVRASDLQFQEYAGVLVRALKARGFEQQAKADDANIVIFLSYAISEPTIASSTSTVPIYGVTGGGMAQSMGTVSGIGGMATFNATTTAPMQVGVQGYQSSTRTVALYRRRLMISAHDFDLYKATKQDREVWRNEVVSLGNGGNLREVLPVLVAQAAPYFARQVPRSVEVTTRPNDASVKAVTGEGAISK